MESGVDSSSLTDSMGLSDADEKARKEEMRWNREFDKKRQEFNKDNPNYVHNPTQNQPQTVSSGITSEDLARIEKDALEKKKKSQQDRDTQEKEEKEKIKQQMEEARKVEPKPQPKYDAMPTNLDPKKEKDFITLRIEKAFPFGGTPKTPSWVTDEPVANKTKKFPQRVLEQINFARQNPKQYAQRLRDLCTLFSPGILDSFIFKCPELHCEDTLSEGISGIEGLIDELDEIQPMGPLELAPALSTACLDLIDIQGPKGLEGLDGETDLERRDRFFRYCKTTGGIASQVVSYGAFMPVHVCLMLMLDDGRKERPKRKDLLNKDWKVVGIHMGKHSKKQVMVAMIFAHGLL